MMYAPMMNGEAWTVEQTTTTIDAEPVTASEALMHNPRQIPLHTEGHIDLRSEFGWVRAHISGRAHEENRRVYMSYRKYWAAGRWKFIHFMLFESEPEAQRDDDRLVIFCDDGEWCFAVRPSMTMDDLNPDLEFRQVRFFVCQCGTEFAVSTHLHNWYSIALRCPRCETATRTKAQRERRESKRANALPSTCAHCHEPMQPARVTRKYCSSACRVAALRARRAPESLPDSHAPA